MDYRIWGHKFGYYVVALTDSGGTWHDLVLFGDDALQFESDMESVNDKYTLSDIVIDLFIGHPSADICRCDHADVAERVRKGCNGHTLIGGD